MKLRQMTSGIVYPDCDRYLYRQIAQETQPLDRLLCQPLINSNFWRLD
ncbi:hypothetical protein [Trichocoleus sp. FACHB-40]|nr:hypothetical protein [Trichocoleus sp. FACHB-40]